MLCHLHVQDADSAQDTVLPAGLPCMVTASLSSLASSSVVLQSVRLEGSSADTGDILVHCPDLYIA